MELSYKRAIPIWLYTTAFFVFAMAVSGAITRLTESGLSMVEWRPFIGALPPLHEDEWNRVFDLYKQTPEYLHKNFGMALSDFKSIFFWEWFHRLWGRLIGLVYGIPFFYFLIKGAFTRKWLIRFTILLILGGLQGGMGWYMVMSGLVDNPDVSHYRLAAHLGLAAFIFSLLIYYAALYGNIKTSLISKTKRANHTSLMLVFITLIWGAFVAGTDSGLIYNSFPKMDAYWFPPELWDKTPLWINFFENHTTIQFTHRLLALCTVTYLVYVSLNNKSQSVWYIILGALALIQLSLGIATLVSQVWIPLAALHQAVAFLLIGCTTFIMQQEKIKG